MGAKTSPEAGAKRGRDCVLVLGMHRSGTSAATRVLSLLGAALPAHLLGADRGNVAGHWEPERLYLLHERMLVEAGSRWDDWREFDPAELGQNRLAGYKEEIRRLIMEEYGDAPLLVLKEPRICRFVPLYAEILGDLGIRPHYLHILRNPLAVIASLTRRDQMTEEFVGLLWLRHVLDAERATRGQRRAFLAYESLLGDWRAEIDRVTEGLGIDWPRSVDEAAAEIEEFVSTDLEHHSASMDELDAKAEIPRWIKETYVALRALARSGGENDDVLAELMRIGEEFDAAASIFGPAAFAELATREARMLAAHQESLSTISARDARIEELNASAVERDAQLAELRASAAERDAQIEELTTEKSALEGEVEELREEVETVRARIEAGDTASATLRDELSTLYRSRSWRMLKPARETFAAVRRFRLYLGRTVEARARSGLRSVATRRGLVQWEMTDHDPQFDLTLPDSRPLPPGIYRLNLEIPDRGETLELPRLYVDSGSGFSDDECIVLDLAAAGRDAVMTYFAVPGDAFGLRFDPSVAPGELTLGRIRLRKISSLERYSRIVRGLSVHYLNTPKAAGYASRRALSILSRGGLRELARKLRERAQDVGSDYQLWIQRHDRQTDAVASALRRRLAESADPPRISVVMPVYNTPEKLLRAAIESVVSQIYSNWELCVADDCSSMPHVREVLEEYRRRHSRIRVAYRDTNGHISRASNTAFDLASGEWIALLDHDDLLHPAALAEVALEIVSHPDAELIYTDEDKLGPDGMRYAPYFKPDYSRELLRSQNYLSHLTVHRAENVRTAGAWRPGFEGSQDYDLILRIIERIDPRKIRHIPKVLYHWRAIAGSTALATDMKDYAHDAGLRALREHVARTGFPAAVESAVGTAFYRVRPALPDPRPRVDLIIPSKNNCKLLRNCVNSILARTTYEGYLIWVLDNGSTDSETLQYLDELAVGEQTRVLGYPAPFNYAAINNFGVRETDAPILGLINDDIEVIASNWLAEMVSWAAQPDVGCVGAKLYYRDNRIQHAGVILGLGGVAGHAHWGCRRDDPGYFGRAALVQNYSAVTAACLVVRRDVYEEVGGLNERDLPVAFNDVDFCIRVREAGYHNVWTPYAELYHLESASRGSDFSAENANRFRGEVGYMWTRWRSQLKNDPYYSPHLTRVRHDFSLPP